VSAAEELVNRYSIEHARRILHQVRAEKDIAGSVAESVGHSDAVKSALRANVQALDWLEKEIYKTFRATGGDSK